MKWVARNVLRALVSGVQPRFKGIKIILQTTTFWGQMTWPLHQNRLMTLVPTLFLRGGPGPFNSILLSFFQKNKREMCVDNGTGPEPKSSVSR